MVTRQSERSASEPYYQWRGIIGLGNPDSGDHRSHCSGNAGPGVESVQWHDHDLSYNHGVRGEHDSLGDRNSLASSLARSAQPAEYGSHLSGPYTRVAAGKPSDYDLRRQLLRSHRGRHPADWRPADCDHGKELQLHRPHRDSDYRRILLSRHSGHLDTHRPECQSAGYVHDVHGYRRFAAHHYVSGERGELSSDIDSISRNQPGADGRNLGLTPRDHRDLRTESRAYDGDSSHAGELALPDIGGSLGWSSYGGIRRCERRQLQPSLLCSADTGLQFSSELRGAVGGERKFQSHDCQGLLQFRRHARFPD